MTEVLTEPLPSSPITRWSPSDAPLDPPTPPALTAAPALTALPALPEERSHALDRLLSDDSPRGAALRAGAGLLATMPFALTTGLASNASGTSLAIGALTVPVSLALIALVGLSASTIGVSLLSSPISPSEAADVGGRALLRAGLVLFGLSPITVLWIANYVGPEALIVPSLAWGIAGALGTATLNARFVAAVHPDRTPALGTLAVMSLLSLFTIVVGIRVWVSVIDTFHTLTLGPVLGGAL